MKDALQQKGRVLDGHLPFVNPATGEVFGQVAVTTPEAAQGLVDAMRAAQPGWGQRTVRQRVAAMQSLYNQIFGRVDEITAVITQDTGKPRQDALIELFTCLHYFRTAMRKAPRWLRRERVGTGLQCFKRAYIDYKPYGVVAVISPWNYPFVLTMNPLLGALLAGNAAVVKPSEVTPAVGALVADLFAQTPILRDLVRVAQGDGRLGQALVQAPPDLVFVTGSVRTGQRICETAATTLTPVISELGGKDPMLVLEDADIEAAARWGTWGAFSNSGQTCMAPERIYVVEAVHDRFVEAVLRRVQELEVGYTLSADGAHGYGAMTHPRQLEIVQTHLADAVAKGAQVLSGGHHEDMFFEPTVVTGVDPSMLLAQQETFGAVMSIYKVADEAEAIAQANDSMYGLSASVFSEDLSRAKRVAAALEVGSVNINDTISHYGIPELPFGGTKASGNGRSNGRDGLRGFTQPVGVVYGKPLPWDISTQLREPGNYRRAKGSLFATLAPTWRQRLDGLRWLLGK